MLMKINSNRLSQTFLVWALAIAALLVFAAVSIVFFSGRAPEAHAAGGTALKGWAWSNTIGWISFNSSNPNAGGGNYSVKEASDGTLSGHAWSSSIGWISFNSSDVSGCPSGVCVAKVQSNGDITGWARVLSANGSGGWSGWISFSGTVRGGGSYGAKQSSGGSWSDFAWGNNVVGWIGFSGTINGKKYCVSTNDSCSTLTTQPLITKFKATPPSVSSGTSATLVWTSLHTSKCSASGAWSGALASGGSQTVTPSTTSSYKLTCTGTAGGSVTKTTSITVYNLPSASISYSPTNNSVSWKCGGNGTNITKVKVENATGGTVVRKTPDTQTVNGSFTPSTLGTHTLFCTNKNGTTQTTSAVLKWGLSVFPPMVKKGTSVPVTLKWSVKGIKSLTGQSCAINRSANNRNVHGRDIMKEVGKLKKSESIQSILGNHPMIMGSYTDNKSANNKSGTYTFNHQTAYSLSCGGKTLKTVFVNIVPQYSSF